MERIRALGFLNEDGSLNYDLVLEAFKVAFQDKYLKHVILHTIVKEFPSDLKKLLGVGFARIRLKWSDNFEYFLILPT